MTSLIETIKAALPIAPFLAPYTGGLKSTGPNFLIGRCPFHQKPDDPPNKRKFWVNTKYNICGCFVPHCPAYCNTHADPSSKPLDTINFYARINHLSNRQAIEALARQLGIWEEQERGDRG